VANVVKQIHVTFTLEALIQSPVDATTEDPFRVQDAPLACVVQEVVVLAHFTSVFHGGVGQTIVHLVQHQTRSPRVEGEVLLFASTAGVRQFVSRSHSDGHVVAVLNVQGSETQSGLVHTGVVGNVVVGLTFRAFEVAISVGRVPLVAVLFEERDTETVSSLDGENGVFIATLLTLPRLILEILIAILDSSL
jgi:hypothetical protein